MSVATSAATTEFQAGNWSKNVDVRDFIQLNYTPYLGDDSFLVGPTPATLALWDDLCEKMKIERAKGIYDADTQTPAGITAHLPGYIQKDLEKVVGLQTDGPFKRAMMPNGGVRMVIDGLNAYGMQPDPKIEEIWTKYRKTHNQGVFDVYSAEMRNARKTAIITGLPDAYGRGRIIGDYRRVALYGIDALIQDRKRIHKLSDQEDMTEDVIREREETSEQIRALQELKEMAATYGCDISKPAQTAQEAVQWTYFAYLAAVKEQNGAAMSLGRVSTFLDVYFERDLAAGLITEEEAQEIMDQFVMKLRIVRFLRTPEYDALFSGDPTWVTESIAGIGEDGRPLVTKTSFRVLQTLYNLGPAPEPNLTVLWSEQLPEGFKQYCAKASADTSSIQYENDDIMRPMWGDDYGIACCVSAMRIGKQMQFFGARANLAKALLYAINGGKDEKTGDYVGPQFEPITSEYLDFDELWDKFNKVQDWLARLYIRTLNAIHYMHDKYAYERIMMALHDREVYRTMACGIAGLSVAADSLSAVKYAKVKVIRDERGLAVDFETEGEFPKFGNNDDRVDSIAQTLVQGFMDRLKAQKTYRGATPTQSVLTITSNVVYGKKTGTTPDGRKAGEPFAPGANPMHGRDTHGAVASLSSVAKLPYGSSQDGISYTFSIIPEALGKTREDQIDNLVGILDGYAEQGGHHVNVNVLNREMLLDAMENPDKYPQLTIRVSGYAVNFVRLTKDQQKDVITRTFHVKI